MKSQPTIATVIIISAITFVLAAIVSYCINKNQTNEIVSKLKQ